MGNRNNLISWWKELDDASAESAKHKCLEPLGDEMMRREFLGALRCLTIAFECYDNNPLWYKGYIWEGYRKLGRAQMILLSQTEEPQQEDWKTPTLMQRVNLLAKRENLTYAEALEIYLEKKGLLTTVEIDPRG